MKIQFTQISNQDIHSDSARIEEKADRILLEFKVNGFTYSFVYPKTMLAQYGNFGIDIDRELSYTPCCKSTLILNELSACRFEGAYRSLFEDSKAIELLLINLSFVNNLSDSKCFSCKFLNQVQDRDKINKAREIIDLNLKECPTILMLSTMVGINQCYLKKGFKELFHLNIGEYITDQKINKAKHLLNTTQNSISEIAETLGFSNLSNFSNSFRNQLGITPLEYREASLKIASF